MSEIPRPLRPERRIIFGDGLQAQLLHLIEGKKDVFTGEEVIIFRLVPLEYLRWQYKITDDQYTNKTEWWIEKSYPKKKCWQIGKSPFITTWIVLQTYDGRPGWEIEEINKELEMRYEDLKHRYDIQNMIIANAREKMKNLIEMPDYMREKAIKDIDSGMRAATATSAVPAPPNEPGESNA